MDYTQVEQRTEAWHKQRVGRITGSVAGAILGLSPWQTPGSILRQMVRAYHGAPSEFVGNPATEWGTKHERQAMLCFMRKTGIHVEDVGFLPYDTWLGASPDGLTDDGAVLEIKTPFSCRKGKAFKPLSEQPHYAAQIYLEMLASGRKSAYFAQYHPPSGDPFSPDYIEEGMLIERVEWCDSWWTENEPKLHAFHTLYVSELNNPAHLAPLRVTIDTDEARHIINRMGEIDDALHNLEQEKKAHMAKLVEMAENQDAEICGRKLTQVAGKKTVQYAKALAAAAPNFDLSAYTTTSKTYWKLS